MLLRGYVDNLWIGLGHPGGRRRYAADSQPIQPSSIQRSLVEISGKEGGRQAQGTSVLDRFRERA